MQSEISNKFNFFDFLLTEKPSQPENLDFSKT